MKRLNLIYFVKKSYERVIRYFLEEKLRIAESLRVNFEKLKDLEKDILYSVYFPFVYDEDNQE
jgi:hypothetical protein